LWHRGGGHARAKSNADANETRPTATTGPPTLYAANPANGAGGKFSRYFSLKPREIIAARERA
jgi:hypothetical protein